MSFLSQADLPLLSFTNLLPIFTQSPAILSTFSMGGSSAYTNEYPAQRTPTTMEALEIARDSEEGARDPTVINALENALTAIWNKIEAQPTIYIMTRDEFAIFNYFQGRFEGIELASAARKRTLENQQRLNNILVLSLATGRTQQPPKSVILNSQMTIINHKNFSISSPTNNKTGNGAMESNSKAELLLGSELGLEDTRKSRPRSRDGPGYRIITLVVVGVFTLFFFGISGYFATATPSRFSFKPGTPFSTPFNLVKNAIQVALAGPTSAVLECFQVYQPVLAPSSATDETTPSDGFENTTTIRSTDAAASCQSLLMEHSFGFSYGIPFVGNYVPPECKFNRVSMNFTVTSRGRQFDRLALMYFNDTEVWRTSTAEPTTNGIRWEYIKDMTEYLYFWNSPQTLIFDLGNLIDDTYTGFFNTTLTATFFTSDDTTTPASLIYPISTRKGASNLASVFMLPSDNATNTMTFPKNVNRAVFSVSACGQGTEEFWWANVLQSDINSFVPVAGTLYGYSPFREVQVLIDGQLAGVSWPFPTIFTGGVVPGLWRPIVGMDAFDLKEHEIDITPWLSILCDGKQHTFEIRVVGIEDDGKTSGSLTQSVGASWYVTGKIFIWQDSAKSITVGTPPTILLPAPVVSVSQTLTKDRTGANETLEYTTDITRKLSISSQIITQSGTRLVTWTQNLSVKNYGLYTLFGAVQVNRQTTSGIDQSKGGVYYKSVYTYPLFANTTYLSDPVSGNFTLDATVNRGLSLSYQGSPVHPTGLQPFAHLSRSKFLFPSFTGTSLNTVQNGTAHYFGSPSARTSSGYGSTSQEFEFKGLSGGTEGGSRELYRRSVEAVNGSVVRDVEHLVGEQVGLYNGMPGTIQRLGGDVISPKEALGRGPGRARKVLVQSGN